MVAAVDRRPRHAAAGGLETRRRTGRAHRHPAEYPAGARGTDTRFRCPGGPAPPSSRRSAGKAVRACCAIRAASRSGSGSCAECHGSCRDRGHRGPHCSVAPDRGLRGCGRRRCRGCGGRGRGLRRAPAAPGGGIASPCGRAAGCAGCTAARIRSATASPQSGPPGAVDTERGSARRSLTGTGTGHGGPDAPQR